MRISKTDNDDFPRFSMVEENFFVQDSLCLITGERLEFLLSVLNSDMGIFQYFTHIVSLDDGGMQMRQQYIEQIPIPKNGGDIEDKITHLFSQALDKNHQGYKSNINNLVYRLYDLTYDEISYIQMFNKQRFEAINSR
jgi:hypothetical protein